MKRNILHLITAALFAAPLTQAGEATYAHSSAFKQSVVEPDRQLFNRNEWQFDLFGAYAFTGSDDQRVIGENAWGGGLGANYFFTGHFGIGPEVILYDTEGNLTGSTAANLFLRLPIEKAHIALYVYGGAGVVFNADDLSTDDFKDARDRARDDRDLRNSDDVLFEGHAGVGIEYRWSPHFGIFTDARYTWVESSHSDYATIRSGFRFAF